MYAELENIQSPIRYEKRPYIVGYAASGHMIFWQQSENLLLQYSLTPGVRKIVARFNRITLPHFHKFEVFVTGQEGGRCWLALWDNNNVGMDADILQAVKNTGYCKDDRTARLLLKKLGFKFHP